MPWVKLDDKFHDHPKITRLSAEAVQLHVFALCWSVSHLTDGFIPDHQPARLIAHPARKTVRELVEAGLWEPDGEDGELGWRIHDYSDYQPSREKVLADREAAAERQSRRREAARKGNPNTHPVTDLSRRDNAVSHTTSHGKTSPPVTRPRPDPTRPNPKPDGFGAPASGAADPEPVENQSSNDGRADAETPNRSPAALAAAGPPSSARRPPAPHVADLVSVYVDTCTDAGSPPGRQLRDRIGKHVRSLIEDGKDPALIERAVRIVATENKSPAALEFVVGDIERGLVSANGRGTDAVPAGWDALRRATSDG